MPRGLSLSLYLFLICAEGLSALIKQFMEQGMLKGVVASMRGPKISHLFFIDDNLIFCGTTHEDCATLENILETYEQASRRQLNREKTGGLYFSCNTPQRHSGGHKGSIWGRNNTST